MAFWVNFRYKNVTTHIFHQILIKFGEIYVLTRFYSENSLKKAILRPFLGHFGPKAIFTRESQNVGYERSRMNIKDIRTGVDVFT